MRVSLIQTESNGTKQENEKKIFKQLEEAVLDKPDIICLSELFLSWGKDFSGGKVNLNYWLQFSLYRLTKLQSKM